MQKPKPQEVPSQARSHGSGYVLDYYLLQALLVVPKAHAHVSYNDYDNKAYKFSTHPGPSRPYGVILSKSVYISVKKPPS